MRIFVLEDNLARIESFKKWYAGHHLSIAMTADDAIAILQKDLNFEVLFLDHDLGGLIFVDTNDENTGSRVAKFLSDKDVKGRIIIHSWNPIGAFNMRGYLPKACYVPISTKREFDVVLNAEE